MGKPKNLDDPENKTIRGTPRIRKEKTYTTPPKKGGRKRDIKKVIKEAAKKHAGAPANYDKNYHPAMAYVYCSQLGASYETLAKLFSITPETIWAWKKKYPELFKAIRQGLDDFNSEGVEKTIVKSAMGYEYPERKYQNVPMYNITETVDPDTGKVTRKKEYIGTEFMLVEETWKHVQPNPSMLQFYAVNRISHRWANLHQLQVQGTIAHIPGAVNGSGLVPLDVTKLDDATLDAVLLSIGHDGPPRLISADDPKIEDAEYADIPKQEEEE